MGKIVEILKNFDKNQRLIVLILVLFFSSITSIITTYLKTNNSNCSEVVELNKKYVKDFVSISNLILQERMKKVMSGVNELQVDSGGSSPVYSPQPITEDTDIMDSILVLTQQNIKK